MKFFEYCATQYAIINHEIQVDNLSDKFDLKKQSQTKATHELIESQRKWFKFWAKVYFIFNYLYCSVYKTWPEVPKIPKPEPVAPEKKEEPKLSVVPNDGQEARN